MTRLLFFICLSVFYMSFSTAIASNTVINISVYENATQLDCPTGFINCADKCVDPTYDPRNCGACDNTCGPDQYCESGICVNKCQSCGDGKCDAHSAENCSTCPADCPCPAGSVCINGTCRAQ